MSTRLHAGLLRLAASASSAAGSGTTTTDAGADPIDRIRDERRAAATARNVVKGDDELRSADLYAAA